MFKKLVMRIVSATKKEELNDILYDANGVDMMFQKEKITWQEHEALFELVAMVEKGLY